MVCSQFISDTSGIGTVGPLFRKEDCANRRKEAQSGRHHLFIGFHFHSWRKTSDSYQWINLTEKYFLVPSEIKTSSQSRSVVLISGKNKINHRIVGNRISSAI